jgi:hypothetical protein
MWGLCHRQTRWMGKDADGLRLHDEQTQDKTRPKTINERTSSRSNSLCQLHSHRIPAYAPSSFLPQLTIFITNTQQEQHSKDTT